MNRVCECGCELLVNEDEAGNPVSLRCSDSGCGNVYPVLGDFGGGDE